MITRVRVGDALVIWSLYTALAASAGTSFVRKYGVRLDRAAGVSVNVIHRVTRRGSNPTAEANF
jgi:hypothetical protein